MGNVKTFEFNLDPYQKIGPLNDDEILKKLDELDNKIADELEGQFLDFKEFPIDGDKIFNFKKDLASDIVSFANSLGGTIILGVKDKVKGKENNIIGIPQRQIEKSSIESFLNQLNDNIQPPRPSISGKSIEFCGKILWIIKIEYGNNRYFTVDGIQRIRLNDQNEPFNYNLFSQMKKLKDPDQRVEFLFDDFNFEKYEIGIIDNNGNFENLEFITNINNYKFIKNEIFFFSSQKFNLLLIELKKTETIALLESLKRWKYYQSKNEILKRLIIEVILDHFDDNHNQIKELIKRILKDPYNEYFEAIIRFIVIRNLKNFEDFFLDFININIKLNDFTKKEILIFLSKSNNDIIRNKVFEKIDSCSTSILSILIPELDFDLDNSMLFLISKLLVHQDKNIRLIALDALSRSKFKIKNMIIYGSLFDIEIDVINKAIGIIFEDLSIENTYMRNLMLQEIYQDKLTSKFKENISVYLEIQPREFLQNIFESKLNHCIESIDWPRLKSDEDDQEIYFQIFSDNVGINFIDKIELIRSIKLKNEELRQKIIKARDLQTIRIVLENLLDYEEDVKAMVLEKIGTQLNQFELIFDFNSNSFIAVENSKTFVFYPDNNLLLIAKIEILEKKIKLELINPFRYYNNLIYQNKNKDIDYNDVISKIIEFLKSINR